MSEHEEVLVPTFKVKCVVATGPATLLRPEWRWPSSRFGTESDREIGERNGGVGTTKLGAQEALPTRKEVERFVRLTKP